MQSLPGQPNQLAQQDVHDAFAAEKVDASTFFSEFFEGVYNRRNGEKYEKAVVAFARRENVIKTKASLELLAELLNLNLPKNKKDVNATYLETLLFGANSSKSWSFQSFEQRKRSVLETAKQEVEEAERDLTKAEQTLTQAPAPVENDMEMLPLLRGDAYNEYDAREFTRTAAVRLQLYKEREQRRKVAGQALDVFSQNLTQEENERAFTNALLVLASRAGVFPFGNNDNSNDDDNDERMVRRAPVNALSPIANENIENSPPHPVQLHPCAHVATKYRILDERNERTTEDALLRLGFSSDDEDVVNNLELEVETAHRENIDALLEDDEEFADDWNKPGADDDD